MPAACVGRRPAPGSGHPQPHPCAANAAIAPAPALAAAPVAAACRKNVAPIQTKKSYELVDYPPSTYSDGKVGGSGGWGSGWRRRWGLR